MSLRPYRTEGRIKHDGPFLIAMMDAAVADMPDDHLALVLSEPKSGDTVITLCGVVMADGPDRNLGWNDSDWIVGRVRCTFCKAARR